MPVEAIYVMMITALILVSTFAVAIGLLVFIKRYITRVVGKTRTKIDDYAVTIVKGPVSIFIILFGVITAIRYLNSTLPGALPDWLILNVDALTTVMGILVATSVVSLILNKYLGERIKSIIRKNPDRETTFRLLHHIALYIIITTECRECRK